MATGTGVAPFVSVVKDPAIYERFEKIVVIHGCRLRQELDYGEQQIETLRAHDFLGEAALRQLLYYPTVTREKFRRNGRVTDLLASDAFAEETGLPRLDPETDRMMICGSSAMLTDMVALMRGRGFEEGSLSRPASYVIEKAFVDR